MADGAAGRTGLSGDGVGDEDGEWRERLSASDRNRVKRYIFERLSALVDAPAEQLWGRSEAHRGAAAGGRGSGEAAAATVAAATRRNGRRSGGAWGGRELHGGDFAARQLESAGGVPGIGTDHGNAAAVKTAAAAARSRSGSVSEASDGAGGG
eukprot:ctg_2998.g613